MLRELTIEKYRCFRKLHVKDLAQVNLIVGKNNVGKTSFLEAVYLYVSKNNPKSLLEILSAREQTREVSLQYGDNITTNYYQLSTLFNTPEEGEKSTTFVISSDLEPLLFATLRNSVMTLQAGSFVRIFSDESLPVSPSHTNWEIRENTTILSLPLKEESMISSNILHDAYMAMPESIRHLQPHCFIDSRGLGIETLRKFWDEINLTPEEDAVEAALRILKPKLERIGFTNRDSSISGIKIRLQGQPTPIPLSDLGDGMRRILGLAMSLAISKSGYLIVDEIDAGLHYKTQTEMWRLVLETAKRLNVQVFATTHSWDCIAAFQSAMEEMEDPTIGKLIRLDARGEELRAIEYDAEDLEITVAQGIEVR
jgi:AAA15 family ATPase/GTPase